MIVKEFTSKRLSLTKEEREISKSWGSLWAQFGALERRGRPILLIFGDWSGYRSSQYRVTHIDKSSTADTGFRGTVQFTDNTTMNVWVRAVTREEIITNKWYRRQSYTDLIRKLITSGQTYYKV